MRRVALLVGLGLALGILLARLSAHAQPPAKVPRIGLLVVAGAESPYRSNIEAFRSGLRNLGYVEGKNIAIEHRWAEGRYDRLSDLAGELVRLKVDVIVTHGTPGSRAAKQATTTIPIVMAVTGDAVATGLVASLARPGGNITGSSFFFPELNAKRLEVLKDALPGVTRVPVLLNPGNPAHPLAFKTMEVTARSLGLELQQVKVRGPDDFDRAFSAMGKREADALAVVEDAMFHTHEKRIADLAARSRLPTIGWPAFVEVGGLMAYGVSHPDLWRRAAVFVDKILKGTKPADLPVEQPTRFELVINLKTAKALGLTIPQSILIRADRVIK